MLLSECHPSIFIPTSAIHGDMRIIIHYVTFTNYGNNLNINQHSNNQIEGVIVPTFQYSGIDILQGNKALAGYLIEK